MHCRNAWSGLAMQQWSETAFAFVPALQPRSAQACPGIAVGNVLLTAMFMHGITQARCDLTRRTAPCQLAQ